MNRIAPFIVLFVIAIILQPILIVIDCIQTPASVAEQFIEDYYALNTDMQDLMCTNEGDPATLVNNYLYSKRTEAAQRGFNVSYLRQLFTHIHVEIEHQTAEKATVHITGTTRTAINRAFMVVGKLFRIGKDYHVDRTLELVKDNGEWRVCPKQMGMNS